MIQTVRKILGRSRAAVRRVLFGPVQAPIAPAPGPIAAAEPAKPRVVTLAELAAPGDEKFVLFFAPDAGVVPHYMAHCVVARTLEERGQRALILRCHTVYPRCVVMDGELLPMDLSEEQRTHTCRTCRGYADTMTGTYGLSVVDLADLIDDGIRDQVRALLAAPPADLSTFEIDGFKLGRICGAEAAVTFKTTDFTGATTQVRKLLLWYIEGALLSYFAMQKLLATGKIARVVHFNEYAILLASAIAARRAGVPATFMSMASVRGVDRRRLVFISDPLAIISYRSRLKEWDRWRNLRLPAKTVRDLSDDAMFRSLGQSVMVYSPTRTTSPGVVYERLGLDPARKLLVAFTSSIDEVSANNLYLSAMGQEPFSDRQPFADQIEWLEALIAQVEASNDRQLVIRIHPREGANRRESTVSQHLGLLKQHFDRPYIHVRVVWPGDDVSSYDLMELADVGLSAWSSTSLEMARFGVPAVVAFDKHTPLPVDDVVLWAETPEAYFALIDRMLAAGPELDRIRFAYRWTHLHILGCSIDMGDVIPTSDYGQLPQFTLSANSASIERVLCAGVPALEINREALQTAQGPDAENIEREAILRELRRLIWVLCFNEEPAGDYRLCVRAQPNEHLPAGFDAALDLDGDHVELRRPGKVVRRRSRMVQRLGPLVGTPVAQSA